jgi:hypothetical protein
MKHLAWIVVVVLVLAFPLSARADVAPPAGPPGANPGPEWEPTQVRMIDETVLIDVFGTTPAGSPGRARITADFTMRNLGTQAESMAARFPISGNDGSSNYPEVQDIQVLVDGEKVTTRRIEGPAQSWGNELVPWAEFDVTFPPGEDVPLRVAYTLDGTGEMSLVSFYYILATGAGWKDTIGSADLIVRLPYEASAENIFLEGSTGWSVTTPGGVISGTEIRWHHEDLEPTPNDNLEVTVVRPDYWMDVLEAREQVAQNPNDGEAWGQLGKAYKDVIAMRRGVRMDPGGKVLFPLTFEAYENAVDLLPDDALWHAGLADLLANYAYFTAWEGVDTRAEALRAMQEIHTALELAPRDARVGEIAEQIYWTYADAIESKDGAYTFLWLTATPTLTAVTAVPPSGPTTMPVATRLSPRASPIPPASSASAANSATPEPQPASGIRLPCGSAAVAALPMVVLVVSRRRGARGR